MRGALAIAAAHVRANRLVLWGLLAMGVWVLFLAAMVHGEGRPRHPGDPPLAAMMAMAGGSVAQMCLAVALGAGAISRDLAERRLGFYLARPVSPLAYWAAKMAAAFFVAYTAGWLVLVPGLLVGAIPLSILRGIGTRWVPALIMIAVTAFLMAAASVAGGAIRSRSGLLIVDFLMLPLTGTAFFLALGNSWDAGTSVVLARFALPWLFALVLLFLLAAGAAQVGLGRLQVRRGHAWLSAITWGGLLACIGGALLFSRYVASATPADLRPVFLHTPRTGSHVVLEGLAGRWSLPPSALWLVPSHFYPGFVLDEQGRFSRMGGFNVNGFAWSDDGRRFAWSRGAPDIVEGMTAFGGNRPLRGVPVFLPSLWVLDTSQPGAVPRRIARMGHDLEGVRALSPSGRRLLIAKRTGKAVVDAETGETLASLAESDSWRSARFLSETVVRALRMERREGRVVEWDLAGGRLKERGGIAMHALPATLVPSDDWQRVHRLDGSGLFLHDLDGRVVATLVVGWTARMNRLAGPLSGGRFGSVEEEPNGLRLRIFDPEGRPLVESRLEGRFPLRVGGESSLGLLALGVSPRLEEGQRATVFVDLSTGGVVRSENGLWPALRRWEPVQPGDSQNPEPGSLGTRLFQASEGLVKLDPATGARSDFVRRRERVEN
jgi:hypothetical protein